MRKTVSKEIAIIMILTCFIGSLILLLSLSVVSARSAEKHINTSGTVIVGDSRALNLWQVGFHSYSLIASGGGRYGTDDFQTIPSRSYSIGRSTTVNYKNSRYAGIMIAIKKGLKKHHKCRVIIMSTINDCNQNKASYESIESSAGAVLSFARKCRITYRYKKRKSNGKVIKKKCRAKVYILKCPKAINGIYPDDWVNKYNNCIKQKTEGNAIDFVDLRDPEESEYTPDGVHFLKKKSGYNSYIIRIIRKLKYK